MAGGLASFLFLALSAGPASGQTVQGQLLDLSTGAPVEGALVLLLDAQENQVAGYLSNATGRFFFRASRPGFYTVRSERIGYETTDSDPFELTSGQSFVITLETAMSAVVLEEIRVEGEQQCVVRPEEGLEVARVWDEARKALTVQEWTDDEGLYRFQLARYERDLDPYTTRVRTEERRIREAVGRNPVESLPVDTLLREGFIIPTADGDHLYYGPDASVLLSDPFLDTHCFRLRVEAEHPRAVGLSFEPVRKRRVPDIEGTLWLDRETAKLIFLEYGYDWAPWEEAINVASGRVEFQEMPNGAWIIRKWWIRMPRGALRFGGAVDGRSPVRIIGITEVGGEVLEASAMEETVLSAAPRGQVRGQVWDSTRNVSLEDAKVFLSGTPYSTEVDRQGRFTLDDVPEGRYSAAFSHPLLDSLGVFPPGVDVKVVPGEVREIRLGTPSLPSLISAVCGEMGGEEGEAAVTGLVRRGGNGAPVPGATVTLEWRDYSGGGGREIRENVRKVQVATNEKGRYRACGIPADVPIRARASYTNWRGVEVEIAPTARPLVVQNLQLDPRGDPRR